MGKNTNLMSLIETTKLNAKTKVEIYQDNATSVQYLAVYSGEKVVSFTPRLKADGSPVSGPIYSSSLRLPIPSV